MGLDDLQVYNLSIEIGEIIWNIVSHWSYFEKDTLGKQTVRAVDSISANISEGFGRFHYKENKQFLYFARGSLFETKTWLWKANKRMLIDEYQYKEISKSIELLGIKLNNYINSIGKTNPESSKI